MTKKPVAKSPKLEFRYSWIYDQENRLRFTDPLYPSGDEIREYVDEIKEVWKPRARTLLNSIPKLSGLSWRESSLVCYVVGRGLPMSDPLTMPVYKGAPDTFLERLAYQLVERMVLHPQNLKARAEFWEEMFRDMTEDGVKVSYMVPVNALYREIQSKYFKGSSNGTSLMTTNMDYRRAWEIVDSTGHSEIMERLRRGKWD